MIAEIDVRAALPQIRVPTLLLHRTGDRAVDVEASRYAAGRIPRARLVELPDGDNPPFVGDSEAVAAEIEEFLTGSRPPPMPDRVLATIVFTDIAGSPNAPPRWAIAAGASCSGATTPWPEPSWSGIGAGR
jgi:hypothetical protein